MPSGDTKQELSDVIASLENASQAFRRGDFDEAEPAYRKALEVLERVYGAADPDTIACLQSLGDIYYATGRYQEALPLYQRLLTIGESVLGKNHPGVVEMVMRLGTAYEQLGRGSEAEQMYRRACQMSNTVMSALKPPQPFQPAQPFQLPPSIERAAAESAAESPSSNPAPSQSPSWRTLDVNKLSGNFLDPSQDVGEIDLTEPKQKPSWKNKKGARYDKSRGRGKQKSALAFKDSVLTKFKLYADFFIYGLTGIILLVVIGYAVVSFTPKKTAAAANPKLSAYKKHTFSSADNYMSLTIGGAKGDVYSLGHNPQGVKIECVGPGLVDFIRASIASLSDRQIWFEDVGNALRAEDGSYLYIDGKGSPERRVIDQMMVVGRTAQYWYQAGGKYPEKTADLSNQAYINPFNNKQEVPLVTTVTGSNLETSEIVDSQFVAGNLFDTLSNPGSAMWHEEAAPQPGAIHCLSVVSQTSPTQSDQSFFVHAFDRNGKLLTGRGVSRVFLLGYLNGKSQSHPSGGIKPKSSHPRSVVVYIATLTGVPLNLIMAHFLLPCLLSAVSVAVMFWAYLSRPQGGAMSDSSSLAFKLALLGLLLAAGWAVLATMP